MPPIVADPVITFLRHRAYTEEHGHHADCRYPSPNIRGHKTFPQWDEKTPSEPRLIRLNEMAAAGHRMCFARRNDTPLGLSPGAQRGPALEVLSPVLRGLAWRRAPI